jgi:membrane protein implicated in regulation of membrane protease activity
MTMEPWLQTVVTVFCSVIVSSGLWAFLQSKLNKKDAEHQMILGFGEDRIIE